MSLPLTWVLFCPQNRTSARIHIHVTYFDIHAGLVGGGYDGGRKRPLPRAAERLGGGGGADGHNEGRTDGGSGDNGHEGGQPADAGGPSDAGGRGRGARPRRSNTGAARRKRDHTA